MMSLAGMYPSRNQEEADPTTRGKRVSRFAAAVDGRSTAIVRSERYAISRADLESPVFEQGLPKRILPIGFSPEGLLIV